MENKVRLIDANALMRKWQDVLDSKPEDKGTVAYLTFELFIDRLKGEPTINPETLRPKGKWKLNRDGSGTCSECNRTRNDVWDMDDWDNFCSHCGADMR